MCENAKFETRARQTKNPSEYLQAMNTRQRATLATVIYSKIVIILLLASLKRQYYYRLVDLKV
jgi:hypothetical protein